MACNNVTSGCGNGNYCPLNNSTRAQIAASIVRALYGEDFDFTPAPHFSDVPDTHWAFKYIQRLFDDGITGGCGGSNYCPSGRVNRSQMAAIIARAFLGML